MKFFSSNFDFENFIGIEIVIENRFRINRSLIEKALCGKHLFSRRSWSMRGIIRMKMIFTDWLSQFSMNNLSSVSGA